MFVTFRTRDSIPAEVLQRWEREKNDWLQRRGHATDKHWSKVLPTLDASQRGRLLAWVCAIIKATGCALVYVTHQREELPPCISHCIRLRNGRVTRKGPI